MPQYTVKKSELNKFKFGNVVLEGFESDQKAKWGFNTGQKNVMPPCQAGDLIEADLGENNKGYPTISNIKVVGKSDVKSAPKYKGQEFRTPDQNMRTDAVNLAMTNIGELTPVEEIILMADEFFDYIKNGNSPVNVGTTSKATGLAANQMPEDVPPFP